MSHPSPPCASLRHVGPVHVQFAEQGAEFLEVPNLQPAALDADGQAPSIGTDGQRQCVSRERQKFLQGPRFVKPGMAKILCQPPAASIGRNHDLAEVGQRTPALPRGCAPEFHASLRRTDRDLLCHWRKLEGTDPRGMRQFGDAFQFGEAIYVERWAECAVDV